MVLFWLAPPSAGRFASFQVHQNGEMVRWSLFADIQSYCKQFDTVRAVEGKVTWKSWLWVNRNKLFQVPNILCFCQEVLTSATHFLTSEVDILSGFYTRSFLIWGKEQWNSTLVFATWEVSILLLGFSACFFCHESSGKLPRIIIRDLDRRIRGEALSPQQFLSSFASWFSGNHAIWRLNYLKSQVIFASKIQETYHLGLINQTLLTPLLLT